jgi:FixJ family two-component response regulator
VVNQTVLAGPLEMRCDKDTVYVIDPDKAVHDAITTLLGASGMRVECFPTAEAFLATGILHSTVRGCLLVEADLPGIGSLALVRQLRAQNFDLPVVFLTSTSDRDIASQALKAGANDVFEKPLVGGHLLDRLNDLGCCAEAAGVRQATRK